jgi:hypothetical protein
MSQPDLFRPPSKPWNADRMIGPTATLRESGFGQVANWRFRPVAIVKRLPFGDPPTDLMNWSEPLERSQRRSLARRNGSATQPLGFRGAASSLAHTNAGPPARHRQRIAGAISTGHLGPGHDWF